MYYSHSDSGVALAEPVSLLGGPLPACKKTIDAQAQQIIDDATDTSVAAATRAAKAIKAIVTTYYPKSVGKFKTVTYDSSAKGLSVSSTGKGKTLQGEVTVGKDFLANIGPPYFARRVLQVGHEIIHVNQLRAGLGGGTNRALREFLAHCWTALAPSFAGTGCVSHSTRVGMIDCALRYYRCMSAAQQKPYGAKVKALLARRPLEIKASGNTFGPAPKTCSWPDIAKAC